MRAFYGATSLRPFMKSASLKPRVLCRSISLLLTISAARLACPDTTASALVWDGDGLTAGAQDGGGVWNATNTNWFSGSTDVVWTPGSDGIFGAGADGSYAISLGFTTSVNTLQFSNSGYTVTASSPQTITIGSLTTSGTVVVAPGKTATIGNNVTISSPVASQNATISGGGTLVIDNGGVLKNAGTANTNVININSTTVNVLTGGSFVTSNIAAGGNGTAIFVNGTLNVMGGTVNDVGTLGIGQTAAGTMTITNGTVAATSTNGIRFGTASGNSPGGTVELDGGTLTAATVMRVSAATVTNSILNLNGGTLQASAASTTFINNLSAANVRGNGAIINSGGFNITIPQALIHSTVGGDAGTDGGLTKTGNGTLILSGVNTYNGGTNINGGVLQFNPGAIPATGLITINSGGALNVAGVFGTVASVQQSGIVSTSSSGAVALASASSESIDFTAYPTLMLGASGTIAVPFTGTITPANNTYHLGGGGGTLTLTLPSTLTGVNNAVFGATGSKGTVVLTGAQDYLGTTTIAGGGLQLGDGTTDGTIPNTSGGIADNGTFVIANKVNTTFSNAITGSGAFTKQSTGLLVLNNTETYTGTTTIGTGSTLQLGDGATDGSIMGTSNIVDNGILNFNITGAQTYNQAITGIGSIVKQGSGTVILGGTSTFSGTANAVNGGFLQVTSSGALGTATVTCNSGGQLQLSNNITVTNLLKASGLGVGNDGVVKNISGNNTLTNFAFANNSGTRINVAAGSSLTIATGIIGSAANSTAASFRVLGSGILELDGDNTSAIDSAHILLLGDGTNPGPTVVAGNDGALGAGQVSFQNASNSTIRSKDATAHTSLASLALGDSTATFGAPSTGDLTFQGAVTFGTNPNVNVVVNNSNTTFNGNITDGGTGRSLTKTGNGALVLSGAANSYTGSTSVNGGALIVSGSLSGTTLVDVAASAKLGGIGTINAVNGVAVESGGILAPGNSGIGTLTLDGNGNFSSLLTMNDGASFKLKLNTGLQSDTVHFANDFGSYIIFTETTINFSDLSGGALASGAYTLFSSDNPGAYINLTVDANNRITDGLLIGSGLNAYPGSTLSLSGGNIVLTLVPEPSAALFLLGGLSGLLGLRRRRSGARA